MLSYKYGALRRACNIAAAIVIGTGAVQAETITIAALGDSLTQGYGLIPEDGFVPQLEGWLIEQGADVSVLNAGVSGDTTAGGLSRVAWTLTPDVDAMIVALGGNDLLRGIPPEVSRANIDGILTAAKDAGVPVLLIGMEAPNNYGPDYKLAFDTLYPDLAAQHGVLFYPSFLSALYPDGDLTAARDLIQADGVHPNAQGVEIIVDAIGPYVLQLIEQTQ